MAAKKGRLLLLKRATLAADVSFTVDTSTDLITAAAHGLTAGDMVTFVNGAAPGGFSEGKIYYVITPLTNTFGLSLTAGGSAIDITSAAAAACVFNKITALTTVAGLTTNSITINNEPVDVTTKDDEGWRRLLEGVAFKSVSMSAAGRWQTAAGKSALVTEIIAGTFGHYQLIDEAGGKFEGSFLMSSLEDTGVHDGVEEFTINLESTGGVAWTAGT